jgi:hypothetical protein
VTYCAECARLWDALHLVAPALTLRGGVWDVRETPTRAYRLASDALRAHRMSHVRPSESASQGADTMVST